MLLIFKCLKHAINVTSAWYHSPGHLDILDYQKGKKMKKVAKNEKVKKGHYVKMV